MFPKLKIKAIPRAKGVTNRLIGILLAARFTDELLGGLPNVLMPTIRSQLGLSYTQITLLSLAFNYVTAIVEPINGLLIDFWKRRWLMVWGALGIGLGTIVIGIAPTFAFLLLGFVVYGMATGPLAHTADVVLVEAYPTAPDRAYSRATLLDTVGAMLAPLLVTLIAWLGFESNWLLVILGMTSLIYAGLIVKTNFPEHPNPHRRGEKGTWKSIRISFRMILSDHIAVKWLLFLLILAVLETPMLLSTVWLREQVGMSQALIGVYKALEMATGIISLVYLDRWLSKQHYRQILIIATVGLLILYPAWILADGIWQRFLLSVPISFLFTVYWPIGKAQSLTSVPGRAGTMTAVQSLLSLIPLPILFGLLAQAISLTMAMFWVYLGGSVLMLLVVLNLPKLTNTLI